ncbi:MAG: carboxymuconolactone decarboxylase family protein [Alphaproteobacteria bacterium]
MSRIAPARADSDDPRVAKLIREIEGSGPVWNVTRTLANSPPVLRIFRAFATELPKTGLSPADREVIDLQMAVFNGCHYCVPAHIKLARETGLAEGDIKAVVEGGEVSDARGRLIQELTLALVETKGKLPDDAFDGFVERGVKPALMIEIIAEIAHCTLTNYTNRLAQTDFDDFLAGVSV